MEGLSYLDKVAYVRFASVYKNFKEVKDFEQFVGNLDEKSHNHFFKLAFEKAKINLGKQVETHQLVVLLPKIITLYHLDTSINGSTC